MWRWLISLAVLGFVALSMAGCYTFDETHNARYDWVYEKDMYTAWEDDVDYFWMHRKPSMLTYTGNYYFY